MRYLVYASILLSVCSCGELEIAKPVPIIVDCLDDGEEMLCGQANIHVRDEAGPELPLEFSK